MVFHRDGKIAATIVEHLEHIHLETERATIWPVGFVQSVNQFKVEQPEISKLRNIKYKTKSWNPHENEILKLSTKQIGSGVFQPHEVGICGKITPQALMGRITETLAHMIDGYPEFKDSSFISSDKLKGFVSTKFNNSSYLSSSQFGIKWNKNKFKCFVYIKCSHIIFYIIFCSNKFIKAPHHNKY